MSLHLKLDTHSYCSDLKLEELTGMTDWVKTEAWKAGNLIELIEGFGRYLVVCGLDE